MMTNLLPALAEAWLPAFILAVGLTLGALVALALGHLLREAWLAPLHAPLSAMARAAPVLLPLALPLLLAAAALYPWAATPEAGWYDPAVFRWRSLGFLVLWVALGRLLARDHVPARWAGAALMALVLTGAVALEDWALSRDQGWTASLQGLALLVEQVAVALALSTLLVLRGGLPNAGEQALGARSGLERALLVFAIATLWLWFLQFIVVYAANLPQEAAWYLRRSQGGWGWLKVGIALPALLAAIGLALVPLWRDWRLAVVCGLLVAQPLAHLAWVVRPDAALAGGATAAVADVLVFALMAAAMALAVALGWRRAEKETSDG